MLDGVEIIYGIARVIDGRTVLVWPTEAEAVQIKPSRITGMERLRVLAMAPAMAASSRPPRQRSTSSGSERAAACR